MAHNVHVVILAGGSGSRFWPLSRELSPKQMLEVFGKQSLLVQTIERAAQVMTAESTLNIVVGEALLDEIRNHLKAHHEFDAMTINYIVEPCARNTAPALALAAATIKLHDPTGIVMMLPSDHLCESGNRWLKTARAAIVRAHADELVTIGLVPTRPETGYGYIKMGEQVAAPSDDRFAVHKVDQFVEKPGREDAERFVAEGTYLWNSGMLVASARAIIKELRAAGAAHPEGDHTKYSGKIASVAETLADQGPDAWKYPACKFLFEDCPSVPFDKAVLEVSEHVSVVPAELDWNDVGSLEALEMLAPADMAGNRLIGHTVDVDSHDIVSYSSSNRMIATLGLNSIMVVDTADATLVAARDRAQDVRQVFDALKAIGAPELAHSKTSLRPWGSWTMLVRTEGFHVKEVDVLSGHRLSLQSHSQRAEHWIVVSGQARVTRDGEVTDLGPNESVFIPIGCKHRLENIGSDVLRIVEVATGEYLGEDDITRIDDDFGR